MPEFVVMPDPAEISEMLEQVSNWGRWGDDDQLGTVNLIDRAAGLDALTGSSGRVVPLARPISRSGREASEHASMLHFMQRAGESAGHGYWSATDWFGLAFHGFEVTHLDALSHIMWDGKMYNGVPAQLVTTTEGATTHSVDPLARGIVGRAVLIDAPRHFGVDRIEPGIGLTPDDLDAILEAQRTTLQPGDMLLLRTGRDVDVPGGKVRHPMQEGLGGLGPACLGWLRRHDVALLGSDAISDTLVPSGGPHPVPIHVGALVGLGLPLLDNAHLEELSAVTADYGRWTFHLTIAPLWLQAATGSPVTPLAVI